MNTSKTLLASALLAALAMPRAHAADPVPQETVSKAPADAQEGMVVTRDAQTGKLRNATPAEVKVLKAQESRRNLMMRQAEPAPVVIRKDGTLHKHLGERSLVYSVVTRDESGKVGMQCVTGADAADAALTRRESRHDDR